MSTSLINSQFNFLHMVAIVKLLIRLILSKGNMQFFNATEQSLGSWLHICRIHCGFLLIDTGPNPTQISRADAAIMQPRGKETPAFPWHGDASMTEPSTARCNIYFVGTAASELEKWIGLSPGQGIGLLVSFRRIPEYFCSYFLLHK